MYVLCKSDSLQLRADAVVTFLQITGDIWRHSLVAPSPESSLEDCRINRLTAAILSVMSRTYSYNSAVTPIDITMSYNPHVIKWNFLAARVD